MAKTRKPPRDDKGRKSPAKSSKKTPARKTQGGASARTATAKTAKTTASAGKTKTARVKPTRPRKSILSRKELAGFREMLLAKRRELVGDMSGMEEIAARKQGSGNLSSMPTHMADVGTDNFEHEFTLGLLESEQQLLREINQALKRIEDGTYGICLGTNEPIPKPRLQAKPWAKYTVEYARMLEKGLVRPAEEEGSQEQQPEDLEAEGEAEPTPAGGAPGDEEIEDDSGADGESDAYDDE